MRTKRAKPWLWGILAVAGMVACSIFVPRVLPELKTGDVDPLGALIGAVSLVVAAASLVLAVRALRPPAPTPQEAAKALAQAVKRAETAARRQLLGDDDTVIDVSFTLKPASGHTATSRRGVTGARAKGRLAEVVDYYRRLTPRRLVITGAPGAGKTVTAVELILGLIEDRSDDDPVPVRLSAATLDTGSATAKAVETWLLRHLRSTYGLRDTTALALVNARLVTPVIDGLDEMDPEGEQGYDSRAGRTLRALNAYQDGRTMAAVVLTCRSTHYEALEQARVWRDDPARVELAPVSSRQARDFLTERVTDPDRWTPVLQEIKGAPRGPLAQGLSTPWRLTLATVVYEQRTPTGDYVRDPADLTGPVLTTPEAVRDHLLGLFIPAVVALAPSPGAVRADHVHRWLTTLACYLHSNSEARRTLGRRPLSGTDLVLHQLWPLAGTRRPRLIALVILVAPIAAYVGATDLFELATSAPARLIPIVGLSVQGLLLVEFGWTAIWRKPQRANLSRLRTTSDRRVVMLTVAACLATGLMAGIMLGLLAGLVVGALCVALGLIDFESDGKIVSRDRVPSIPIPGLTTGLLVGLPFGVSAAFAKGAADGVTDGLVVAAVATLAMGLMSELPGLRYLALLLCTRRWNAVWLPWRLGRFLDWAYEAGLMRVAGMAYQFRHRELQDHLAAQAGPVRRAVRRGVRRRRRGV